MYSSPHVTLRLTGGARAWLELELDHNVLSWGEELRGSLVFAGGWNRHRFNEPIRAELAYVVGNFLRVVESTQLTPGSLLIHPRTTERLPFQILMPEGVPFQRRLELRVMIPLGFWNQLLSVQLRVAPPPGYHMFAWHLMDLTGTRVRYWSLSEEGTIIAHLQAASPEAWFAGRRLELSPPQAPWCGTLVISRKTRRHLARSDDRIELPPPLMEPLLLREQLEQLLRVQGYRPRSEHNLPLPVEQPSQFHIELPIPTHEEGPVTLD